MKTPHYKINQYGNPDCPDAQGRFTCVICGKRLKRTAQSSICPKCIRRRRWQDGEDGPYDER